VFNIGNSRETTIENLARMVIEQTGSSSPIRYLSYDQVYDGGFEDMRRRVPNVSKLRATIGFAPEIPLEAALDAIIGHFQGADTRRQAPVERSRVLARV
jgi:UDP-glucose 4-epimerase